MNISLSFVYILSWYIIKIPGGECVGINRFAALDSILGIAPSYHLLSMPRSALRNSCYDSVDLSASMFAGWGLRGIADFGSVLHSTPCIRVLFQSLIALSSSSCSQHCSGYKIQISGFNRSHIRFDAS